MNVKNILRTTVLLVIGNFLLGCAGGGTTLTPNTATLSQERLFLRKAPLVVSHVKPTIPFPPTNRGVSLMSTASSVLNVIAPEFIEGTIDLIGASMIELSGKNDKTTTIESELSNFFYKDATYNTTPIDNQPSFNLLFVSANFGKTEQVWQPKGLDSEQGNALKKLYLVAQPNFLMEAKIFPIPHKQYMEIVPTYIFYNKKLNAKGFDEKRDLEIHFSFYDITGNMLSSEGSVVLKNVQVGKEYGEKELANVRTTFMKMPKISDNKEGYSGGYKLKVSVTETRDINEWLASLGESISNSKGDIRAKLYLTDEEKIERDTSLAKAKIEVEIIKAKIIEAKERGDTKAELLELESQLLDKKAEANKKAVTFGKPKFY